MESQLIQLAYPILAAAGLLQRSPLPLVWSIPGIAIACWVVMPKPRLTQLNLLFSQVATTGGLICGVLFGLLIPVRIRDQVLLDLGTLLLAKGLK